MEHLDAKGIIAGLLEKGWTKWQIKNEMGVSWQTVYMWQRGTFKPNAEKIEKLNSLLIKIKGLAE